MCGAVLVLILRELRAEFAPALRVAVTLLLCGAAVTLCAPAVLWARQVAESTESTAFFTPLLRAVGIGLVCEFAAAFCRDMGETTLADGVTFFGRAEILLLCLPSADKIWELAKELLQF